MIFKEYLETTVGEIETTLSEVLSSWRDKTRQEQAALLPLVNEFISQCDGGKRIRGALVKLGYEIAGGTNTDAILTPAAAFEIFNTAILAHDDIIDKSELRRGKPSLYQALGGDHYGISQAISLGDLGFFLSTELISGSDFPIDRKNKAVVLFSQTMQQTAFGEMFDVLLPTKESFTDKDVLEIARLKTAAYSIIGPLSLGAILAGAPASLFEVLQKFGENLGIAFQIHDDNLGIFGNAEELGKSVTSDIAEGKRSLLLWHARRHAGDSGNRILDTLYGKPDVTEKEAEEIKAVFLSTSAYDYAIEQAKVYTENARAEIPTVTNDPNMQILLSEMTSYLLERKK